MNNNVTKVKCGRRANCFILEFLSQVSTYIRQPIVAGVALIPPKLSFKCLFITFCY